MFACRENILKTAKALVEDTKTLVAGAASNQEQLAGAAQSAVMTITRLADCVKHGAASLGSEQPEAQVGDRQSLVRILPLMLLRLTLVNPAYFLIRSYIHLFIFCLCPCSIVCYVFSVLWVLYRK